METGTVTARPVLASVQVCLPPLLTQQIVWEEQVFPKIEDKTQVNPRRAPVSQQTLVVPLAQVGAEPEAPAVGTATALEMAIAAMRMD